ncbi:hypothetical protein GCM10027088_60280 [Nocardia goodfellowii]
MARDLSGHRADPFEHRLGSVEVPQASPVIGCQGKPPRAFRESLEFRRARMRYGQLGSAQAAPSSHPPPSRIDPGTGQSLRQDRGSVRFGGCTESYLPREGALRYHRPLREAYDSPGKPQLRLFRVVRERL